MKILQVLEATTYMTDISSNDFGQMSQFFSFLEKEKKGYNLSLDDVMRFVLTIKSKKSALRNVAGSGEEISRSLASSTVGREANLARGFSDTKDVNLGETSIDNMHAVGKALEAAGYAELNDDPRKSTIDRDATARLLKFINTIKASGFNTPRQVAQNFEKAVGSYRRGVEGFKQDIGRGNSDLDIAKDRVSNITPNMLMFLAAVVKKKGRSAAWDNYLNPDNYDEPPLPGYTPGSYNPREAAKELIAMGLTTKTPKKGLITLNKDAIKKSVSALRNELEELKTGSIEQPGNVNTKSLKAVEQNAKALIDKIDSMVPNDIKRLAESKLAAALRKASEDTGDDSFIQAYNLYTNKLAQSSESEAVGDASERIKKTHLGSVIAFLRARIIGRMLYHYASMVIGDGKKWKAPNKDYGFTGPKELSMVRSALKSGDALKTSRLY